MRRGCAWLVAGRRHRLRARPGSGVGPGCRAARSYACLSVPVLHPIPGRSARRHRGRDSARDGPCRHTSPASASALRRTVGGRRRPESAGPCGQARPPRGNGPWLAIRRRATRRDGSVGRRGQPAQEKVRVRRASSAGCARPRHRPASGFAARRPVRGARLPMAAFGRRTAAAARATGAQ